MTTRIEQWGNECAIRIPSDLADKFGLTIGREVEFAEANGLLVIRRVRGGRPYRLADLLKGCEGKPHPDPWPEAVGRELI